MEFDFKRHISEIYNFPNKGIIFRDISPLLKNNFTDIVNSFSEIINKDDIKKVDYFVGIDARGFIFASAFAQKFSKGFVMIRKSGKLPPPTIKIGYSLEYACSEIEMALGSGNVIVIDDVNATGGTMNASIKLCQISGYNVLSAHTLINIANLNKFNLKRYNFSSLIEY